LDRQLQIQILLDHYQKPRHWGVLEDADVVMPGGNPGCGDVVTVYLEGAEDHEHIADVSYEGEGCTISMAASSMLLEQVVEGKLTMDEVLALDYNEMIDQLGRQIVASRPKCATLGLGTLKAAIRRYQQDKLLADAGVSRPEESMTDESGLVFGEGAEEAARKD
jgi:nitrogen fixation NifU-like protein